MKREALSFLLVGCLLLGCGLEPEQSKSPILIEEEESAVVSNTFITHGERIQTIEHDDHLFILYSGTYKASLLHHPDCPCQIKTESQNTNKEGDHDAPQKRETKTAILF